jgi:hypothetical protein
MSEQGYDRGPGYTDAPLTREGTGFDSGPVATSAPPAYYGQQQGYGAPMGGYGMNRWAARPRREYPIETKPFFLTSEFAIGVVAVIGLLITAATNHTVGARLFWYLTTAMVVGYMISRGIAKSGTRSQAWDPRETFHPGQHDGGNDR